MGRTRAAGGAGVPGRGTAGSAVEQCGPVSICAPRGPRTPAHARAVCARRSRPAADRRPTDDDGRRHVSSYTNCYNCSILSSWCTGRTVARDGSGPCERERRLPTR
ncbi:hypothetical protein EVAR_92119_1 [Eumeta japonica]|uniref:Uncharacterized protein n=1 Tax=Eumeta variegata TaxID=151549 RepID=A0A4C1SZ73_EUMVA|nr:hypothetical protein EVAR_92119_1 [Eumeta japonica]